MEVKRMTRTIYDESVMSGSKITKKHHTIQ